MNADGRPDGHVQTLGRRAVRASSDEALTLTDFTWESPQAEVERQRHGRELALALQDALPDVTVRY